MIRILVVDDHPSVRAALEISLNLEPDMKVIATAADGPTALRLAHERRPDVLVLDLCMPGMSGVEVIRLLPDVLPEIRIVAFTGDDEEREAALASGAFCVVVKDAPLDDLLRAIRFASHAAPLSVKGRPAPSGEARERRLARMTQRAVRSVPTPGSSGGLLGRLQARPHSQ